MAVITNTLQSTAAVGNREDISDVVDRITPEDTPMYTAMGKGKAAATNPGCDRSALEADLELFRSRALCFSLRG